MTQQHIQPSFNSGEWSPKLYGRVDLTKYRSGAALLLNWFVDYRGGASTRPGTKYVLQCYKSSTAVRLISFQASFTVGYVLEFGNQYIRFFFGGAPVLEAATTITATIGTGFVDTGHSYHPGDWVFINNAYYIIDGVIPNIFTLTDLFGNSIIVNPFPIPTNVQRVYTIPSPYQSFELATIKFAQNVNQLILCHPNHAPQVLTIVTATNWTLLPIVIGTEASPPGTPTITSSFPAPGSAPQSAYYSYVVTSVNADAEESNPSAAGSLGPDYDLRTVAGTISIAWATVAGAVGYNVYKTSISYFGTLPAGSIYGFIGSTKDTTFIDDNISADFSQTPPIAKNPVVGVGSGVASVAVTATGTYTIVPVVNFTGAASTIVASANGILQVQGTPTVGAGGTGYVIGDVVTFTNGVTLIVATIGGGGAVATWQVITTIGSNAGSVAGAGSSAPANPVVQLATSGAGTGATANLVWGVGQVFVTASGGGYASVPNVVFSAGAATAVATLSASGSGNPTVPGFFQQRLILAAPLAAPQSFYMSKPGQYFNFDVSVVAQADDSITGTLVSGQLNTIKAMIPQSAGLIMFTDRNNWLINGGTGQGSAVTPSALVANAQSFNGISDVPPIIANFDVLYVQAKGSIVRDSAYNIYANVYTGADISAIASHLFYGYTIKEWAWAEEPFKVVWAVRSDGTMLTLTFLKEQEFIGWAHSTTTGGTFKSVATIVEQTATAGEVDAVYTVVARIINGHSVQYIERVAERTYSNGVADAWAVDCGIQYVGAPVTSFSGAQFLAGVTVTGLADGVVIPPFVMPASGAFTLPTAASKVTVGIGFNCDLQTLPLDLGDPTVQGKVKRINDVDVLVADTLGLNIGSSFNRLVPMKDFIKGNVSSMLTGQDTQVVIDLVNGQGLTLLDGTYTVPGQYCIRQSAPLPATVLAVVPNITLGDGGQARR